MDSGLLEVAVLGRLIFKVGERKWLERLHQVVVK